MVCGCFLAICFFSPPFLLVPAKHGKSFFPPPQDIGSQSKNRPSLFSSGENLFSGQTPLPTFLFTSVGRVFHIPGTPHLILAFGPFKCPFPGKFSFAFHSFRRSNAPLKTLPLPPSSRRFPAESDPERKLRSFRFWPRIQSLKAFPSLFRSTVRLRFCCQYHAFFGPFRRPLRPGPSTLEKPSLSFRSPFFIPPSQK